MICNKTQIIIIIYNGTIEISIRHIMQPSCRHTDRVQCRRHMVEPRVQRTGYSVDEGYGVRGVGCTRGQGTGYSVYCKGYVVKGAGFIVKGVGFTVCCKGCRIYGIL